jgi:hypothetical protein
MSRSVSVSISADRTRLSRRRLNWLLTHPLPLSHQQVVSLSQASCVSLIELTDGREGGSGWVMSHVVRRRESLVLYK